MASTSIAVKTMRVAQIARPEAEFEVIERDIPSPSAAQVRIRVQACGICHRDVLTKEGYRARHSVSTDPWS